VSSTANLRSLPSVHAILSRLSPAALRFPHALVTAEIRRVLHTARTQIRNAAPSTEPVEIQVERALFHLAHPSLRHVINATGVVLHTNLGRAPLPPHEIPAGYSNLEYDLATGKRGKRDTHTDPLFERLLGCPAIAVNNGAAALYLALHELAPDNEVIVSRGELIEIGDGFRIPEIMQRSGCILREVGTTNRTRIDDYRDAITARTRVILRVHPSNFRIAGFTARPEIRELAALAREHNIPVVEDLGSGNVVDLRPFGIDEPLVQDSLAQGVNVVSFSGDKLLGGPQAGILAGDPALISRLRRNPMFRALRLDKLIYQALESTLRALLFEDWDRLPALKMIRLTADEIRQRAVTLAAQIPGATVEPSESVTGGGSTPDRRLPTYVIAIPGDPVATEKRLRSGAPPIICRIENNQVLLDLRTVLPSEESAVLSAFASPRMNGS
jgi:L-seryl-tRNA(Ser) seleniumtransferase